jgi:pre-mRNA-splicing factor SYF2
LRQSEWAEKKKTWEVELKASGLTKDEAYMLDTAEKAAKIEQKKAQKERNKATFGWEAFTSDASYKAYEKQLKRLPTTTSSATTQQNQLLEDNPLDYGKIGAEVNPEGLDRLAKSISDKEQQRLKYSRRRMQYEASNVDYINEDNGVFNKKIKRAFDKYTVEIRQNLERGTAI